MMKKKSEYEPCPFCKCSDRRVGIRRMGNKGYRVICGKCGSAGPYVAIRDYGDKMLAQTQAKFLWNSREKRKEENG